jgi:hypothetical protein
MQDVLHLLQGDVYWRRVTPYALTGSPDVPDGVVQLWNGRGGKYTSSAPKLTNSIRHAKFLGPDASKMAGYDRDDAFLRNLCDSSHFVHDFKRLLAPVDVFVSLMPKCQLMHTYQDSES